MAQNGILSIFIFPGMVWNGITKFRLFFSSMKWFGTEVRAFLSSAEWLGTEFGAFSVPRNRLNSDRMNQIYVCSAFCRIIFVSENGNPNLYQNPRHLPPPSKTRRIQQERFRLSHLFYTACILPPAHPATLTEIYPVNGLIAISLPT